jgi:hypothetical protein
VASGRDGQPVKVSQAHIIEPSQVTNVVEQDLVVTAQAGDLHARHEHLSLFET